MDELRSTGASRGPVGEAVERPPSAAVVATDGRIPLASGSGPVDHATATGSVAATPPR